MPIGWMMRDIIQAHSTSARNAEAIGPDPLRHSDARAASDPDRLAVQLDNALQSVGSRVRGRLRVRRPPESTSRTRAGRASHFRILRIT